MKALVCTASVSILATVVVMQALAANAPNRPPGVGADEWAPISDSMGVVLVDHLTTAGDAPDQRVQSQAANPKPISSGRGGGAALISPVTGYLMVKRGNLWRRLIVIEPVKGPGVAG